MYNENLSQRFWRGCKMLPVSRLYRYTTRNYQRVCKVHGPGQDKGENKVETDSGLAT